MSDTKISQLPSLTSADGADVLAIVNGGQTKKISLSNAKSSMGLDLVSNTSDALKPVSSAQQAALDGKEDVGVASSLMSGHEAASDPHPQYQTEAEADARYYTQAEVDAAAGDKEDSGVADSLDAAHLAEPDPHPQYETTADVAAQVAGHANLSNNPHSVTKAQVNLDQVDNVSDTNKPVSVAQQAALNGKSNTGHTHSLLDLTQSGATANQVPKWSGSAWVPADPSGGGGGSSDHTALTNIGTNTHPQIDAHLASTSNPHSVTKAQVGLSNADNTSDIGKPVSTAQASADTVIQSFSIARANHTGTQLASTISNFASTVIASVLTGLSLATSTVITASDTILSAIGKLQAQITLRLIASNNLSDLTNSGTARANIGLGNVTNTSDAGKPVSTAQQTALDAKAEQGSNIGVTGTGIYKDKTGTQLNFRRLLNGSGVTITPTADDITIASSTAWGTVSGTLSAQTDLQNALNDKRSFNLITIGNTDYTILATDRVVRTSTSFTAPRTWTLPAASSLPAGAELIVQDAGGAINGANNLTIARAGTDTINGATLLTAGQAYAWRRFTSNGSNSWAFDGGIARLTGGNAFTGNQTFGDGEISRFNTLINNQAGTAYSLTAADNGTTLRFTGSSAITLTIPNTLAAGFNVLVIQAGTGQITFGVSGGMVMNNRQTHTKTAGQYAAISIIVTASNVSLLMGDTA